MAREVHGPGHVPLAGASTQRADARASVAPARVYHGIWGLAPYQSLYEPAPSLLGSLLQMPEMALAFGS